MVKVGEIAATTAVALTREHGAHASAIANSQLNKAKAAGKKKITRSDAIPLFSAKDARRLVELLVDASIKRDESGEYLILAGNTSNEIARILDDYRAGIQPGEVS